MMELDDYDTASIPAAIALLQSDAVVLSLSYIKAHVISIPASIESLEARGNSLVVSKWTAGSLATDLEAAPREPGRI